jgi:hypothetical protein
LLEVSNDVSSLVGFSETEIHIVVGNELISVGQLSVQRIGIPRFVGGLQSFRVGEAGDASGLSPKYSTKPRTLLLFIEVMAGRATL